MAKVMGFLYKESKMEKVNVDNRIRIEQLKEDGYNQQGLAVNGVVVMARAAQIWVQVKRCDDRLEKMNMALEVCQFYGYQRISFQRYEKFCVDVLTKKVSIVYNSRQYKYEIVEGKRE